MKNIPQPILDQFARAYVDQPGSLVQYGKPGESSDGILFTFADHGNPKLLKIKYFNQHEAALQLFSLQERLNFLDFLSQNNAPVVKLLLSKNGSVIEKREADNGVWVAYAMHKLSAKPISPKVWDLDIIRNWGETLGKLHRLSGSYHTWKASSDPETGQKCLDWESEWRDFYLLCQEDVIKEKWSEIKAELHTFSVNRMCFGFVHNDPHLWNVRVTDKNVILLDFDVALHHWFPNDIAIACQHVLFNLSGGLHRPVNNADILLDFLNNFKEGYLREHPFDPDWMAQLETFFAYRRILLYLVMPGWRKSDPALEKTWKSMILECPDLLI